MWSDETYAAHKTPLEKHLPLWSACVPGLAQTGIVYYFYAPLYCMYRVAQKKWMLFARRSVCVCLHT